MIKKSDIELWIACYFAGFCPTSQEVDNTKIKALASRLKCDSDKESLTNILEWEDSNINFWDERHPFSGIVLGLLAIFPVLLAICWSISLLTLVFFGFQFLQSMLLIWTSAFISSVATSLVIMTFILRSNRKIPLFDGIINAFKPSISITMLLRRDRKLGICRDYAKLTACLLLNIFPEKEIYFLHSQAHVATGIKIGEQTYMLDQHLPLLTANQWCKREFGSDVPEKIPFLFRTTQKYKQNSIESLPLKSILKKSVNIQISLEEFSFRIAKLLSISRREVKEELTEKINFPKIWKGALFFALNDEVVDFSYFRWLKRKMANELVDLTAITNIEIQKEKEDLVFQISYYKEKT
jgi:predicted transglutaminase-like protease